MTQKSLTPTVQQDPFVQLQELAQSAKDYASASISDNTRRAYRSDWRHFSDWAGERGLDPLPATPGTVALYVAHLADQGYKASTIQRRLAALSQAHQLAGFETPTKDPQVRTVVKGVRRKIKTAPQQKKPLTTKQIRAWAETLAPQDPKDRRDKALILIGYAGALRRSELVSLDLEYLEFREQGVIITIPQSKTNPEGDIEQVAIPYGANLNTCPVTALKRWLETLDAQSGPVFRPLRKGGQVLEKRLSDRAVALVVKRLCRDLGLSDEECQAYAGHSLRSGHATTAIENDAPLLATMAQTRHRSEKVFRGYVRRGNLFRKNSARHLGL